MERVSFPYEVLIRFRPDGSVSGAQVQTIDHMMHEGEKIFEFPPNAAAPLSLENFPESDIMNHATVTALATVEARNARIQELELEIEKSKDEKMKAEEKVAQLEQRLVALSENQIIDQMVGSDA